MREVAETNRRRVARLLGGCFALAVLGATGAQVPAEEPGQDEHAAHVGQDAETASAQVQLHDDDGGGIVDLETLVVSGEQPGPGLWKVSSGGNVLWILGTVEPLPRRMRWMSAKVEGVVAQAQEVIEPPSMRVDADVGVFRGLALVPSLLRLRRNPDGRTLAEMVPADDYARWEVLKARYLGNRSGVERWRPIFAAQELYEAAIRRSGMTLDNAVEPVVRRAARRNDVPVTPTQVELKIADPKAAIREFGSVALDDTECFERTLARIETDLEDMRARANAWALGDVAYLRTARYEDQYSACIRAVTGNAFGRELGLDELNQRAIDAWLEAADAALANNASTFASLPVRLLVRPGGMLEHLRDKGYEIEEPGIEGAEVEEPGEEPDSVEREG